MQKSTALIVVFGTVFVSGQINWSTSSYVINHVKFFTDVMEETVMELERREWCNLKLDNVYQSISDSLYNFLVNGTVMYSNGFLVSIQKIDVDKLSYGVTSTIAHVRGSLHLYDAKVGFDVEATLYNEGEMSVQRYTGIYNYADIEYDIIISKNLLTEAITVSSDLPNLPGGTGVKMIYMPANNVTEALSRKWLPGSNYNSISRWASAEIVPIVLNITNNKIPFPGICIGCFA